MLLFAPCEQSKSGSERMRFASSLLITASLIGLSASPTKAQTATGAPDGAPITSEEIVVTARHRDERLVDVPQSITAINSVGLERANIRRFDDYISRIPNLTASYGASLFGLSETRATVIRGVQGSNTTSYYIDDTPVPSTVSPQVLDLERIEVLRGPQGTLFGSSSMGGSIRFITAQPDLRTTSYRARARGGFTSGGGSADYGAEAAANIVVNEDQTALRAIVQYDHQSGFIRKAYTDTNGQSHLVDNQGQPTAISGSASLKHKLSDHLTLNLMTIFQFQDTEGLPIAYAPLPGFRIRSYTVNHRNNLLEFQKDHWGLLAATAKYDADLWNITSSTSYFRRDSTLQEDGTESTTLTVRRFTGVDLNYAPAIWSDFYRNSLITHETRLNFDKGLIADWLTGVTGFYFQKDTLSATSAGADKKPLAISGLAEAADWPNDVFWDTHFGNTTKNYAIYGELYIAPVEGIQFTLGLRKYWINRKSIGTTSDGFFALTSTPPTNLHQTGWVPKAAVSYKVTDNSNIYASYSQGFRIGGSQPQLPSICSSDLAAIGLKPEDTGEYGSDRLKSYEIGFKTAPRGRGIGVDVAAFQIDWSHIQQTIPLACGLQFTGNAGKARIRGGEIALNGRPFADLPLTVGFGAGYLDAIITDPGSLPQAAGSSIYLVPHWTLNASAYYEAQVSSGVKGFVGVDYNYTSSLKTANVVPTAPQTRPRIDMLNARVGARFGRSELALSAKNILNRRFNLGDVRSLAYELRDANNMRLPRVAAARPLQVEIQYTWRY